MITSLSLIGISQPFKSVFLYHVRQLCRVCVRVLFPAVLYFVLVKLRKLNSTYDACSWFFKVFAQNKI